MGTWLHGWLEVYSEPVGWEPVMRTDDFLGHKGWWREPLFGYSRQIENYFDPLPFEDGVPDNLSDVVRFDVLGEETEEGTVEFATPEERFWTPDEDACSIDMAALDTVDWDERRNDIEEKLDNLHESVYENELTRAYNLEIEDRSGNRKESWGRSHLSYEEWIEVIEEGSLEENGQMYRAVPVRRCDFLNDNWFNLLEIMTNFTSELYYDEEDVRLFFHFSY